MLINRRALLGMMSSSTFFLSTGLGAIETGEPDPVLPPLTFPQGVASADPQPDAVLLWTRAVPAAGERAQVMVQVATDEQFDNILVQRQLNCDTDSDFTLRIYLDGLAPNTRYYYRFVGPAGSHSRVGRTRTAPELDAPASARLALASCQNYQNGFYGAWARLLKDDQDAGGEGLIDFVLHVGDFVYERTWPTRYRGGELPRQLPAFPDGTVDGVNTYAQTLADYRHLYRTYLADPYLQAARARWPFVCTWDDHEFGNNGFQAYSNYHDLPQLTPQRKLDANRAWSEYVPALLGEETAESPAHGFRHLASLASQAAKTTGDEMPLDNQQAVDSLCIYRRLAWGRDVDLLLTDSRSYRSPPPLDRALTEQVGQPMEAVTLVEILDAGNAYDNGNPPATLPWNDLPNPAQARAPGTLLGDRQRAWFLESMRSSTARWKLWGNALPILPLRVDLSNIPFADFADGQLGVDAWAGYPYELEQLLSTFTDENIGGVVVLSGDHHMHAAGTLHPGGDMSRVAAVEFNGAGISSDAMFEGVANAADNGRADFAQLVYRTSDAGEVPVWNMTLQDGVLASMAYSFTGLKSPARWLGPNAANPGLRYVDTQANGYVLVQCDSEAMTIDMVTTAEAAEPFENPLPERHRARFKLAAWPDGGQPVLEGPSFEGPAPFPYGD